MAELIRGYQARFYSGDKCIMNAQVKKSHEEAEKEIEKMNELYDTFKYTPWTHAKVEEVLYRH